MPDHDPKGLPPGEAEVRRLLADARHTEPMPADVAERLDRVLAGLADEPAREAPVVALAQRRRRATALLVAAAAVLAVGVGLNGLMNPGEDLSAGESAVAGRPEPGSDPAELSEESAGERDGGAPETTSQAGSAASDADSRARNGVLELEPETFSDRLRERRAYLSTDGLSSGYSAGLSARDAAVAAGKACGADEWGAGAFVPVRYDGAPAVVVFRRPQGDTQVADLFLCGDTEPTRTITLPAP